MLKTTIIAASALCVIALAVPRANAAVSCTDTDWSKVHTAAANITDTTKKAHAMKELDTAKDMMAKKDMTSCATHMAAANSDLPTPF
jgi:hypothetical protein